MFDVSEIKSILKGGGGTDMGVGIMQAMESKPDVIIVITDGLTPWPANPGVPVIVCLFEDRDVPSWARKVIIKRGTP